MTVRAPDGWPGAVGIAVLLGGMLLVHASPVTSPLGGVAGPAGGYLGDFFYASPDGPEQPLDITSAERAYAAIDELVGQLGEGGYAERHRSVVATFASAADAADAQRSLELPDDASAVVLDRLLLVVGLPTGMDDGPTPVAEALDASADVLVEGDRYGEGSIVLDASCTAPDASAAEAISTALGDYGAMPYYANLRPPWVAPPITDDEALARSTYRRWAASYQAAFQSDPWISDWSSRYMAASTDAERRALIAEMTAHVRDTQPQVGGDTHPGVMALLADVPSETDPDGYLDWGAALGTLAGVVATEAADGRPTWFEQRHAAQVGAVRATGTSVEIGWTSFNTFALGATGMLAYLDERGCSDVRVGLSDFDDVSGD